MPSVTSSIEIAAPPEAVFDLISDPRRYPEWVVPTERMIELPEGPMGEGTVYKEYGGIPPFKSDSEWRVTGFEPPRKQVHLGDDGTAEIELTVEIDSTDGAASRLTQTVEIRPRGVVAALNVVMWPLMMRRRAQSAIDETVRNAKRLLESGSTPPSPEAA